MSCLRFCWLPPSLRGYDTALHPHLRSGKFPMGGGLSLKTSSIFSVFYWLNVLAQIIICFVKERTLKISCDATVILFSPKLSSAPTPFSSSLAEVSQIMHKSNRR